MTSEIETIREARERIEAEYKISAEGVIESPGKFEGEMIYVPYFWDMGLDGFADSDDGEVFEFAVSDAEREIFPELEGAEMIELYESDSGFVTAETS